MKATYALGLGTTIVLHPFNDLFSRTTWVSRHQKGKTSLDLNEARGDGVLWWQWHRLDHMQTICTSLHTDNHTNTPSLNFYRLGALLDAKPTVWKHWKQNINLMQTQAAVCGVCLCKAEGADGMCSNGLRQNTRFCHSTASSSATTAVWRHSCPRALSHQRTRWTSRYFFIKHFNLTKTKIFLAPTFWLLICGLYQDLELPSEVKWDIQNQSHKVCR